MNCPTCDAPADLHTLAYGGPEAMEENEFVENVDGQLCGFVVDSAAMTEFACEVEMTPLRAACGGLA